MAKKGKLSKNEVKHIADLARLPLTEKEILKFQKQLSAILDHIDLLSKLNTSKTLPTSQVTGLENTTRKDRVGECLSQSQALANAQKTHRGYFQVKGIFIIYKMLCLEHTEILKEIRLHPKVHTLFFITQKMRNIGLLFQKNLH